MKNLFVLAAVLIIYNFSVAQDCSIYHPTKVGKTLTYTNYKKPGKPEATNVLTILGTENTANGLKINVKGTVLDKKGKAALDYTYSAWCDGADFFIDMKTMVSALPVQDISTYKVETTDLKFPNNLTVGQSLDDASVSLTVEGPVSTGITCNVTNRKVVAIEDLTTPAGTFNCIKITYDMFTKVMFVKSAGTAIEWYAKGVGPVKQEVYDKKGKLTSTNELTSIQ